VTAIGDEPGNTWDELGDMLMEDGQAGPALAEYEASMKNARERLRGFYGAARAADASGDKARSYYAGLVRLTGAADADRDEIRTAKMALAEK
jgi:hypothetical protein